MVDKCKGVVCCTLPTAFKNKSTEAMHLCSFGGFEMFQPMCRCCDVCKEQCEKDISNVE